MVHVVPALRWLPLALALVAPTARSAAADDGRIAARSGAADGERDVGLTFGGGLSLAREGCDYFMCFESRTIGVVEGHLGVMVAPRLALLVEAWGSSYEAGQRTWTRAVGGVGLRAWATQRLWVSGSVGVASARVTSSLEMIEMDEILGVTPSASAAIGFEAYSSRAFAIDLHARSGVMLRSDGAEVAPAMIGAGLSWY